ncbi:MAG: hypothetical protein BZ138_00475, partial [Methanosphaera sp. rholeuAM270]
MNRKIFLILLAAVIVITSLTSTYANSLANEDAYNDSISDFVHSIDDNYTKYDNNITLFSLRDNSTDSEIKNESNEFAKFNKSRPIYFAMDHTNAKDEEIFNTIVNSLENEGFNVVKAEIGPNKMSQNTHYLYENNISNAVVFHLFNGVDPSTIRELAREGNDNRGRIVRQRGNDVVLAWFY